MPAPYPPAAVGDRYLVTFHGLLLNQRIMSLFVYGLNTMVGAVTKYTIMSELNNALTGQGKLKEYYLACCPSNYNLVETWVQPIRPTRIAKEVFTDNLPGMWAPAAPTANLSAAITRRALLAGRHRVSTLSVPFPADSTAMNLGFTTVAYQTVLTDLADQLTEPVITAGAHIMDPVIDNGPLITDFTPIEIAYGQTTVRTRHRRTVGLGI